MTAAAAAIVLTAATMAQAATLRGSAEVIDADTLRLGDQVVRLLDVDAFELAQRCEGPPELRLCGAAAAEALRAKVVGREVRCDGSGTDDYDRLLARCVVGGEDLSTWLVAQGHGLAFRRYSERLVEVEEEARSARRGAWAGRFETPWEYRAHRWESAVQAAPEGCPIKGNINRQGVGIYHTPWGSRFYERTRISTKQGERWFCSEKEALQAGFRAPLVK